MTEDGGTDEAVEKAEPEEVEEADDATGRSRRDLMGKAAVGAAAAGVVWSAPRIEGLSLRPDYAAAQSAVGASFDLTGFLSKNTAVMGVAGGARHPSPPPGLDSARVALTVNNTIYSWRGEIHGSAVGNNCNVTGLDGSTAGALPSPTPAWNLPASAFSGPSVQIAFRGMFADAALAGSTTFTMHVTCT